MAKDVKKVAIGAGVIIVGILALLFFWKKEQYHYIPLPSEINENVLYDGATIDVAQGISTLAGDVNVWYYTEAGEWLFFSPTMPPHLNSLHQLEYGKTYALRLTVYPQDWKVPNF